MAKKRKEDLESGVKPCEHFFVYYDEPHTSGMPGNRKEMVVNKRPQPDFYKAHRLPYCPLCGERHADHGDKG